MEVSNKDKQKAVKCFLDGNEFLLIHIDGSANGVDLPPHLKGQKIVTLKLSWHFRGETVIDESNIEADLLFGDEYYRCIVPYDAVYGVTPSSGGTILWHPENSVLDVIESMDKGATGAKRGDRRKNPTTPRNLRRKSSHLRRIK
ncbi:MAG: hypothetical protein D6808_01185 [Candidatus Dadabacteria bacterium]|nr:MAG: hypothetical protein D6808_01185 [Candidatus Dadabacteria bacterium]